MAAKETVSQPDINVFLRMLPLTEGTEQEPFLTISDQGDAITVVNPENITSKSKDTYHFDRVFSAEVPQEEVYEEIESGMLECLLKGNSVGVFSFGQEGSGKTFTLFGEKNLSSEMGGADILDKNDRRGIMTRACKGLIEKMIYAKERNVELKAQFYQVKQLSIRDLIKPSQPEAFKSKYATLKRDPRGPDAPIEIFEGAQGNVILKGLKEQVVTSTKDLALLYESANEKRASDGSFSHTIMVLNVLIKEVRGITKSCLYLIELASSSPKPKGKSFAGQAVLDQQLNALLKVVQSLATANSSTIVPYGESYLTRVLKDLLAPKNYIVFIGHIQQSAITYEATVNTLNYLQKFRPKGAKAEGDGMSPAARDRLLRKINQENNDLKTKLERIKRNHSKQLEELRQLLGFERDLEEIISRRVTLEELDFIGEHKKTVEMGNFLEKRNQELETELESCNKQLKELHREYDEMQETKSCEYIMMQDDIARLKEDIVDYKQKIACREAHYDKLKKKQEEMLEQNAKQAMSDKTVVVGSIKSILKAKELMAKNTQTMKMTQKSAEEKMYSTMAKTNLKNYDLERERLVTKYNSLIEDQRKEYDKYVKLYLNFRRKKKRSKFSRLSSYHYMEFTASKRMSLKE